MMDRGPWTVRENVEEVYVESGDFHHDVTLTVNGDFRHRKDKLRYAKWLAGRLNGEE